MFLAKVIGNVVATQKTPEFQGMKLLLIQPYSVKDHALAPAGNTVVAVDTVGAGEGECVLYTQGSAARYAPNVNRAPVDAVIVGIVDSVEMGGGTDDRFPSSVTGRK
jgi:ethanolamine utilization protein EutN